jgi:spore protease
MENFCRTDVASEAFEQRRGTEKTGELPGVRARDEILEGLTVTSVEVLDQRGADVLCKPIGKYLTLKLKNLKQRSGDNFEAASKAVSSLLARMRIPGSGEILIACLGNPDITPDAVGPLCAQSLLATRHLKQRMPEDFASFRSVSVLRTDVLASTGIESAENIKAVCGMLRPACVIAVDALASANLERLCSTVQITDTGISPGSGVGNDRAALTAEYLGVPVIAIGVPTVVDASVFSGEAAAAGMFVTPRGIDAMVRGAARLIGCGIDMALHPGLTPADVDALLD